MKKGVDNPNEIDEDMGVKTVSVQFNTLRLRAGAAHPQGRQTSPTGAVFTPRHTFLENTPMKYPVLIPLIFSCFSPLGVWGAASQPSPDSFERMLDAIAIVESSGKADAIGDSGRAVGLFQLWDIYVQDCNRIAKTNYTSADRYCPKKSREMVRIVLRHYGKDIPFDKWAVIHISPSKRRDYERPAAKEYLAKVRKAMK